MLALWNILPGKHVRLCRVVRNMLCEFDSSEMSAPIFC